MDTLKVYNRKRDFNKTGEPDGKIAKAKGHRFVVQHHMARAEHYDFRLEAGGVLISWAVPKGPSFNPKDKRLAVHVEDHPLNYRNFEGIIPKGEYGGGTVMIWDEGTYTPKEKVKNSVEKGSLKFTLYGERLKGNWSLIKLKDDVKQDNWLLVKETDEFAQNEAGISVFLTSVKTGRSMLEIEKNLSASTFIKNPFETATVQLAVLANDIPKGDWVYELKYDGYRILSYIESDNIRLITRNGLDYTAHFPHIAKAALKWANKRTMVLDGEMIITDKTGRSDFSAMQNHIKNGGQSPAYVVFDLLAFGGEDLRKIPLLTRKEKLQKLLADAPEDLHYSSHTTGFDQDMLNKICVGGFEGIIAKQANSAYSGKRNGDWLKIKCASRQEFVVGGFCVKDKAEGISSLLLGYNEDGGFIYAGRVGTGFSGEESAHLKNTLKNHTISSSPFITIPKAAKNESVYWVNPQFVAEIQFTEWTKEGLLRHPSYMGIRLDKPADEVFKDKNIKEKEKAADNMKEKAADNIYKFVKLTNPQKLLFNNPKITKQQVAEYYLAVAEKMLPHIGGRILSTICCPGGAPYSCFFKKHVLEQLEGVKSIQMQDKNDFFYVSSVTGLLSLVQYNTIEFHTWGCTVDEIEKPDMMVFDFDPDEGLNLDNVRQGVLDLKSILDEFKLKAFLKTSGGKGYHVVIPFKRTKNWGEFKDFAKSIAIIMESAHPGRYTSNVRKERRRGKIFVDWMRNTKGATCIAPYSLRARNGAKVSMPIPWDMLDKIAPDEIDIPAALKLLKGNDPWQ